MNIFALVALHLRAFDAATCIEHLDRLEAEYVGDLERIRAKREVMRRELSVVAGKISADQIAGVRL